MAKTDRAMLARLVTLGKQGELPRSRMMSDKKEANQQFPVRFTLAQRIVVGEVFPDLSQRLRLDEPNQRMVSLSLDEMKVICKRVAPAIRQADSGMKRASLRHVLDITERAIETFQGMGVIPAKERIYQFKIMLRDITPANLATNPSERLHPRQTPRAYSDSNGMDQLPSSPLPDQWKPLRRSLAPG